MKRFQGSRRFDLGSSASFAAFLLQAIAAGACGGKAVVDGDPAATSGSGGGGTTGATTGTTGAGSSGTTTTATGGNFVCDAPVPVGEDRLYKCLTTPQGEGCPPADSAAAFDDIAAQLDDNGCGGQKLDDVVCGPDPSANGCCYFADVITLDCGGRPFVIDGAPRVASIASRSDWCAATTPEVASLSTAERTALAEAWARDGLDEHASIASFARFVLELCAVGAPADLVSAAQQAMGDEVRHAELCFGLASAYAGAPMGPGPLSLQGDTSPRATLAAIAAATVREGCIGETLAARAAEAARAAATDPAVREALDRIARDEAEHAALAWRFVAWALTQGDDVRSAVERAFDEGLRADISLRDEPLAPEAHGRLSAQARQRVLAETLDQIVRRCGTALLSNAGEAPLQASV